jgi:hypothetical protein
VLEARHAIEGAAEVLEFGMIKYSRGNWKKGFPATDVIDSLLRHINKLLEGETHDEESKKLHVDHITVNAMFLAEMFRRPEWNDINGGQKEQEPGRSGGVRDDVLPRTNGSARPASDDAIVCGAQGAQ